MATHHKGWDHVEVLSYEIDRSLVVCSGYVTYIINRQPLLNAFSNPPIGFNKPGVGISTHGKDVWDDMGDHNYNPFNVILPVNGKNLMFYCQCTGVTVVWKLHQSEQLATYTN